MQIKKTTFIAVSISVIFVGASFMVAQAYEPLVRLPGLPAEGPLSLSQYIVGLYNFLLSIVGIVAVMMLIIGGMKYIAAAGNASVIADAKDTISNAIFGLLLALLSWVIVSTINPDVLYIKNPASSLTDAYESNLGACGIYVDPVCTCKDEATPAAVDQATCEAACADNCGTTESLSCIYGGTSEKTVKGRCTCVDKVKVISLAPAGTSCNEICQDSALVTDGLNHCYVADFRIGIMDLNDTALLNYPVDGIDRAKAYATVNTSLESAFSFPDSCTLAINAGDYTVAPTGVTPVNFLMDYFADGSYAAALPAGPPPGYFGLLACNIHPYANFMAAYTAGTNFCKYEVGEQALTCPINMEVTFSDGTVKNAVQFIKMYEP